MVDRPPNILYMMYDQAKASALRLGGNSALAQGFPEQMAEQGITFTNTFSPSPICTPSRACVHTGVHPLVHQVTCHQNNAPYNLPQLAELLKAAGYYTAVIGHYEADRNLTRGWHEQVRHDESGDMAAAYRAWAKNGRSDVGWSAGSCDFPAEKGSAHLVTTRAVHMLDGVQAAGQPFFFHVTYLEPHTPYFAPTPYDTLVSARCRRAAAAQQRAGPAGLATPGARARGQQSGDGGGHPPPGGRLLRHDRLRQRRDAPPLRRDGCARPAGEHLDHHLVGSRRLCGRKGPVREIRIALRVPAACPAHHHPPARAARTSWRTGSAPCRPD